MKKLLLLIFIFVGSFLFSQDSVNVFNLLKQSKSALKNANVSVAKSLSHKALLVSNSISYQKGIALAGIQLGAIYESESNYDSSNFYLNSVVQSATKHRLKNELAAANNILGLVLWHQSKYNEALPHHTISLNLYRETDNKNGEADTYAKIGNVYYDLSDFPKSLENFLQALKLYANAKDSSGIADVCNYLGKVYSRLNEKESAKKYLFKALNLHQKFSNNRGIAISYNGLGNLFMDNYDLIKALKFFEKSKSYHVRGGDQIGISIAHINIGTIYDMMFKLSDDSLAIASVNLGYKSHLNIRNSLLDSAQKHFNSSIIINSKVGNQFGLIYGYNGLGDVFLKKIDYINAVPQFQKAYSISRILNASSEQYESAKRLAFCYEKMHKTDSAYFYLKTYTHLKEEVIGEEQQRELFKNESKYEYDKKLQKQKLIKEAEKAIAAEKSKRQLLIIIAIAIVLIIVIYFAIVLNKRLKTTRTQKQLIEEQKSSLEQKNKEIIDSITYAKRIQDAMLTSTNYIDLEMKKLNAESFIVFKPKDIVSGDFYWFYVNENILYYVTADSTGHGVPGGFMSMLGINLLSEIVNERNIEEPGAILNSLRDDIVRSLKTDEGFSKDGMDAVVCRLDMKTKTLQYASANNSFYMVRNGVLTECKSQKMPVGYMENAGLFETKMLDLQKGDVIYTFTDGFADQFGGPKGKKFKYSQLKTKLTSISKMPMDEQKKELEITFESWKNNLEQVDDVCVIGIRV